MTSISEITVTALHRDSYKRLTSYVESTRVQDRRSHFSTSYPVFKMGEERETESIQPGGGYEFLTIQVNPDLLPLDHDGEREAVRGLFELIFELERQAVPSQ